MSVKRHIRRPSPAAALAGVALFVALGSSPMADDVAEAAHSLISGSQIKPETVTTKQVRDRSLRARDFASGQLPRGQRGPAGPRGPQGPRGQQGRPGTSAFASTIPSGETVRGFFGHQTPLAEGKRVKFGVSLPVPAPAGLDSDDVNFAAHGPLGGGDNNPSCTGTREQPTAPAGKVCLYYAGASGTGAVTGEGEGNPHGFFVQMTANGGNPDFVGISGSWAYTAP